MKTTIEYFYFELIGNEILVSYIDDKDNVLFNIQKIKDDIGYDEFIKICNDNI